MSIVINSTYKPKAKQQLFHRSNQKYKGLKGSKGSGKTRTLIEECIALCMDFPGNRGIIARLDFSDLKETTMQFFFDYCPPELILDHNKTDHWVLLRTTDPLRPSRIKFAHCKDPKSFESGEIGFFALDEADEIPVDTFKTLRTRLRQKGIAPYGLLAFNPPSRLHWLHRFFVRDVSDHPERGATRGLFESNTFDNLDNLPAGYIEELKETYSGDELNRFLYGEWGSTSNEWAVLTEWQTSRHVSRETIQPVTGIPIIRGWDFGMHAACAYTQMVGGQFRLLREVIKFNLGAEQFIPIVQADSFERFDGFEFQDFSDPTFIKNREQVSARSIQQVASRNFNLAIREGVSNWHERTEAMDYFLTRHQQGQECFQSDPSCEVFIAGAEGEYKFRENAYDRGAQDVMDNEFSHIHDSVQHCVWVCKNAVMRTRRPSVIARPNAYDFSHDIG